MSVEAKLSMTLDEIIQKTTAPSRGRKRESVGAGPVRSSKNNSRSLRNSAQPYETKRRSDSGEQISLKILVSTAVAGILIGKGGTTIQTLSELTSAKITVAGSADLYPGISQRVVQISGTQTEVKSGLKFVIECIALEVRLSDVSGNVFTWNPRKEINRGIERTDIECLITVPAAAAGGVIGRGGATLRSLSEDSGAVAIMSGKEEAAETQERVITVSGTTASCRGFANRLVGVLAADPSTAEFAFTGGKYGARPPVSRTQRGAAGGGAPANKQGGTEIRLRQPFPTGIVDECVFHGAFSSVDAYRGHSGCCDIVSFCPCVC